MSRNIELKARCDDLVSAATRALELGATPDVVERQVDTYFAVASGRLKLRRRRDGSDAELPSELIWYRRADEERPRASDYTLVRVDDGRGLRSLLAGALGVVVEVEKRRTVYLHDNVRIHLDDVAGLGTFLEFEAIVDATCDDAAAHAKLDRLRAAFGIEAAQVVAGSYSDLRRP